MGIRRLDQVSIPLPPVATPASRYPTLAATPLAPAEACRACVLTMGADVIVFVEGTTREHRRRLLQWPRHDINRTISVVKSAPQDRKGVVRRPETSQPGEMVPATSLTLPTLKKIKILSVETS